MDRDDAAFVANALDSRMSNERAELERLAASSLMRLSGAAARIRKIADSSSPKWPPADIAAKELMAICRHGGALADQELSPETQSQLKIFVDKLRELAAEPIVAANRQGRRQLASLKGRARRPLYTPPEPMLGRLFH